MNQPAKLFYEFGPFRLDTAERLLLRNGEEVSLTPKIFDLLLVLVENGGRILEKDELMKAVWPDAMVEETNLTRNISTLRRALGEGQDTRKYIETIPWRGYRFVASVREIANNNTEMAMTTPSSPSILNEAGLNEAGEPAAQGVKAGASPPIRRNNRRWCRRDSR